MKLSTVLEKWRWAQKISLRAAGKEIGISAATLSRVEHGESMDGETLAKILRWLTNPV